MKICTACRQEKPLAEFWSDKRRKAGLMARCKSCKTHDRRTLRQRNPDADRKRYWANPQGERERHLIRKYGVTQADYDRMLSAQHGKCSVCRKTQKRAFDVDHDHTTGEVRGLLCTSCNRMIGHAGDDPDNLERAAAYLRSFRKSRQSS
jgi:hypothetical protein